MKNRIAVVAPLLAALVATLPLAGCIVAAGNRTDPGARQTLGQELIDLKKARDTGAMTDEEYRQKRDALMQRNP